MVHFQQASKCPGSATDYLAYLIYFGERGSLRQQIWVDKAASARPRKVSRHSSRDFERVSRREWAIGLFSFYQVDSASSYPSAGRHGYIPSAKSSPSMKHTGPRTGKEWRCFGKQRGPSLPRPNESAT